VDWNTLNNVISMAATVAFAVTAVLPLRNANGVDILGATVLGLITAIGGGTVRDVILDVPVFWAQDLSYVWVATGASIAAFYGRRLFSTRYLYRLMLYLDGFGAAMFGIQAAGKVWDLGFGLPAAPVILGVVTAIGGGLIRDTLAGRTTLLMRPELYATPVLLGCIVFVLVLEYLPDRRFSGALVCIGATFALRAAAIHWNLSLPAFARIVRTKQP
jgi:uncharacterized membrane protein YeiH